MVAGPSRASSSGGLVRAAAVLGIGLGGLFDGIVFHQLLQWHHMLSSAVAPTSVGGLQLNTLADGVFHSATWILTVVGVWLLVRARGARQGDAASGLEPGRVVLGGLIGGWGGFNVVDGLINHYLLRIHHVRPGPDEALYDLAFLVWGALFAALGWWIVRSARSVGVEPAAEPAIRRESQRPPSGRT